MTYVIEKTSPLDAVNDAFEIFKTLTSNEKNKLKSEFKKIKNIKNQITGTLHQNLHKFENLISKPNTKDILLCGGVSVIIGTATLFAFPELVYAAEETVDQFAKLDAGGAKILNVVQKIGYWIILIKCIMDLIKHGLQGELHSVGKTIMMYILLYGALFFVPWILKLIEGVF